MRNSMLIRKSLLLKSILLFCQLQAISLHRCCQTGLMFRFDHCQSAFLRGPASIDVFIALTGIQFTSLNNSCIKGGPFNSESQDFPFTSPARYLAMISWNPSQMLENTEITPIPPRDKIGTTSSSLTCKSMHPSAINVGNPDIAACFLDADKYCHKS